MLHSFGQTLPNISLILLYAVCWEQFLFKFG
jgi:hypothetical protein